VTITQLEICILQHQDAIAAHGGTLVNRIASETQRQSFLEQAHQLPSVQLDARATSDLEMIAIGGFSPLTGFMDQKDYEQVVHHMHLTNGLPWSIPVTLSVNEDVAAPLEIGGLVRLNDPEGQFVGVLELSQKYTYDKQQEAIQVYL
jgi:sulfate adenylyltransferase